MWVVFENGLDLRFVDRPNPTCVATLHPYMGKGIIDYLVRANMDTRITSDGRVVGALSRDGVVPGRAAMTVFTAPDTPLVPRACGM